VKDLPDINLAAQDLVYGAFIDRITSVMLAASRYPAFGRIAFFGQFFDQNCGGSHLNVPVEYVLHCVCRQNLLDRRGPKLRWYSVLCKELYFYVGFAQVFFI